MSTAAILETSLQQAHTIDSSVVYKPEAFNRSEPQKPLFGSHFEASKGVNWIYLNEDSPAKFTPALIDALRAEQVNIVERTKREIATGTPPKINYQVFSSSKPGVFNLGGDLEFFLRKIKENDKEGLRDYARKCVDLTYNSATHFDLPITTISLIQGTALGGGFEAALANDIIIAERGCRMGMPEILFNLFPGMGAYHLLSRRIPPAKAEQLILSGITYTSEEMYELGLVDVLADKGEGENAVWDCINKTHGKSHGRNALRSVIQKVDKLDYKSFIEVVDIWVDAAFGLNESDLKTMGILLRSQKRLGIQ
ncbi:crotonase/enoyl-CoA hydratase family protein [Pseudomonadota bacterium]